jgi:hypothetical protein
MFDGDKPLCTVGDRGARLLWELAAQTLRAITAAEGGVS